MSRPVSRHAAWSLIALCGCELAGPAFASGAMFLNSAEIQGNPEFVIFGNVKDERGKYIDKATVRVKVAEHMLEFTAATNAIGRFRTPDIGRAIHDLGYEVDLVLITVSVECPGCRIERREYRGGYRQNKGAIEMNFRVRRAG